jgi:glycerol-3-phosphate acyltransferase PlsY
MILFYIMIPLAYLLGSISFASLIAQANGINLRKIGSGNVGATNLARAMGKKWGYICFFLDVSKGFVPMLVTMFFITEVNTTNLTLWLLVGLAAVIGHILPIYMKFKGGKGVAVSLGIVLGLYPYYTFAGIAAFFVWGTAVLIWRYISLASIIAALVFPLVLAYLIGAKSSWAFENLWPLLVAALIMPLVVIGRHIENIKRLIEGTESKVLTKNK